MDLINKVHEVRMKEPDKEDFEVSIEDFEEVVGKIERKHKRS